MADRGPAVDTPAMHTPSLLVAALLLLAPSLAEAGEPALGSAYRVDIEVNGGVPWIAWSDATADGQLRVQKLDGGTWTEVGPVPGPIHAGDHIDLVFEANVPYVLFSEGMGLSLVSFEGGAWTRQGKAEFASDISLSDPSLTFTGGVPHVVYANKEINKPDVHALFKSDDVHIWGGVDAVTSLPVGGEQPSAVSDIGDALYIAYFDREKSQIVVNTVVDDGAKLEAVGKPVKSKSITNFLGLRADGRALYLAFEDNSNAYAPTFLQLNDKRTKWEATVAIPAGAKVGTKELDWSEKLAVVWLDDAGEAWLIRLAKGAWTPATKVGAGAVNYIAVASDLDRVFVATIDADRALVVREL